MIVSLGVAPFGRSDNHRYSNFDDKFISMIDFQNCRLIHTNVLRIDCQIVDIFNVLGYGYYILDNREKRYYFFITDYNYINDNAVEITIEIDWFTTDYKNIVFEPSFVERIHPISRDADFSQIPENINYAQFQLQQFGFIKHNIDKYLIGCNFGFPPDTLLSYDNIAKISTPFVSWRNCPMLAGVPQGCVFYVLDTIEQVYNVYANAVNFGYTSGVTGIWRVSSDIIGDHTTQATGHYYPYGVSVGNPVQFSVNILSETTELIDVSTFEIPKQTNIENYIPKYNKCHADEFSQIYIQSDTTTVFYNPSQFNGTSATIKEYASVDNNMNISLVPLGYKGGLHYNFSDGLSVTYAISGVLTADNTQQQINQIASGNFNNTIQTAINGATGNFGGALSTVTNSIFGGLHFLRGGVSTTNTTVGTASTSYATPQLPFASKFFHYGNYSITEETARKLDKYFSMFGYQVNETMTPYERTNYTYIKGDINFNGNICDISRQYIKELFSAGVTIWNGAEMYSYENDVG